MLNNNFLPVVIIILGLTLGYFYYSNMTSEVYIVPPLDGKVDNLDSFASLSLDTSSTSQDQLDKLRIFGSYPVNAGDTGKRNPFAPI